MASVHQASASSRTRKYTRLPDKEAHIRLLEILPPCANRPKDIELRMRTFSLKLAEPMRYVAMSYAWGNDSIRHLILVNGWPLFVRTNIFRCLRHLRKRPALYCRRYIWIDSICINQSDHIEKGQQVAMMDRIFGKASFTLIWLSSASSEEFLKGKNVGGLNHAALPTILRALKDGYWWRLWIVQEVLLSKLAYIVFGSQKILLGTIENVITEGLFDSKDNSLGRDLNDTYHYALFEPLVRTSLMAKTFGHEYFGMYMLLLTHSYRRCSIPRDRIYGLLGLSTNGYAVPADYACSDELVVIRALRLIASQDDNTSIGSEVRRRPDDLLHSMHLLCRSLTVRPRWILHWLMSNEALLYQRKLARWLLDLREIIKVALYEHEPSTTMSVHVFEASFANWLDLNLSYNDEQGLMINYLRKHVSNSDEQVPEHANVPLTQGMNSRILAAALESGVPWVEYAAGPGACYHNVLPSFQMEFSLTDMIYLTDATYRQFAAFWREYRVLLN